jgi:hypothetical protein
VNDGSLHLAFEVRDSAVTVLDCHSYESRGQNALAMLEEVVALVPEAFEGKSGYVNFHDFPPVPVPDGFDLMFCSTRWVDEPTPFLPFPSSNSPAWPQVGIPDGPGLIDELLAWEEPPEDGRAFWLGTNLHPSRARLAELSKEFPEALDAELMDWKRDAGQVQHKSTTRFLAMRDHRRYKYLIDCPGLGYSGRIRWLLATGRPVFIVDRPWVEHWHMRMMPWVHYVPVLDDLSDLMRAYRRLEADPVLYRMISQNAKAFVRQHLTRGKELDHLAELIAGLAAQTE